MTEPEQTIPSEQDIQSFLGGLESVKEATKLEKPGVKRGGSVVTPNQHMKALATTKKSLTQEIQNLQEKLGVAVESQSKLMHKTRDQLAQQLAKMMESGVASIQKAQEDVAIERFMKKDIDEDEDDDDSSEITVLVHEDKNENEDSDEDSDYDYSEQASKQPTNVINRPMPMINDDLAARSLFRINLYLSYMVEGVVESQKGLLGVQVNGYSDSLKKAESDLTTLYAQLYREHRDVLAPYLSAGSQIAMINMGCLVSNVKTV